MRLAASSYEALPIGAISARGWLRQQLLLAAEGLTGRMMDIWPDVGPQSGWLGGSGESWERGPYYARGLVALAYTLRDERLIARARPWIEWSLASQRDDGFFGPPENPDWWARMPMLEALRWYHEATGDDRVLTFLERYFRHQLLELPRRPLELWGKPRGGDNLDVVLWLYRKTGDDALLALADLLHAQTSDWIAELGGDGPPDETFDFGHGVNRAMGFKEPAVYYQRSRDPRHLAALRRGWQRVHRYHGQIQGMYSGDEFLHGLGSTQGTELCTIVELLSSLETAYRIAGESWMAEAIERIAYNALPATLSPDFSGHQYFQQPNQVECSPGGRGFSVQHENDLLFGPSTGYGCCAANFHMGWPRLVDHLWLATPDGGLAATIFAPCEVEAEVRGGGRVRISEDTAYPFDEEVGFTIHCGPPVTFPLSLHLPGWARGASVSIDGAASDAAAGETWRAERLWKNGETVRVRLPMPLRLSRWERGSIGIERGPLVYALAIGEEWRKVAGNEPFCDYEVHPTTPWNYALAIDPERAEDAIAVHHRAIGGQPWARDGSSVYLTLPAKRVASWTLVSGSSGPIPESPVETDAASEQIELIPYGCARLRISMFPCTTTRRLR